MKGYYHVAMLPEGCFAGFQGPFGSVAEAHTFIHGAYVGADHYGAGGLYCYVMEEEGTQEEYEADEACEYGQLLLSWEELAAKFEKWKGEKYEQG